MSSNGVQESPHRGFKRTRETPHPKAHGYKPAVPVPPDQLTSDEERYALALFEAPSGKNQSDVYLAVFPQAQRFKRNTVSHHASLLAKKVSLRVRQLQEAVASPKIADAIERQEFWTATMKAKKEEMRDRLRASELLGKAQGDFDEKRESKQPVTVRVLYEDGVTGNKSGVQVQVE